MRLLVAALLAALLAPACARAQHWNESGPGKDLFSQAQSEFDQLRRRAAPAPATIASPVPGTTARQPIPILEWTPPPLVATPPVPPPSARPRSAPRATAARVRREPQATPALATPDPLMGAPVVSTPVAPAPVAAPVAAPRGCPAAATLTDPTERSLAERECEIQRLRQLLDEDRARAVRARQPQLAP